MDNKKVKLKWVLVLFTGFVIRFANVTKYLIYPDSYLNLVVAQNIKEYGSVIGNLDRKGMLYPDFFMWTRPVYPILINLFKAPQAISFVLSVLSIPLVYYLVKRLFKNSQIGIWAAVLLSISFNHAVWSGYLLTEATAVFLDLIFLVVFTASLDKKTTLAAPLELLSGCLFSIAVFCRYEYAILAIPVIYLMFESKDKPAIRLVNFFSSVVFASSLFISRLFPLTDTASLFFSQTRGLADKGYFMKLPELGGIVEFFRYDFVLGAALLAGIYLTFKVNRYRKAFWFSVISIIVLYPTYYFVNPLMSRYLTHLLPFMIIPASFGAYKLLESKNKVLKYAFIGLVLVQVFVSFKGMGGWQGGVWRMTSYEDEAAKKAAQKMSTKDKFLLVSFPEPYFVYSGKNIYSVNDSYPYIYIPDELDDREIMVVMDIGMKDIFPKFTNKALSKLKPFKVNEFMTGRVYHYAGYSIEEKYPVEIYRIKIGQLKKILN